MLNDNLIFIPCLDMVIVAMDKKLSNKIVRDIKQKILSGALRTGDRLPAERDLAEKYKVSRITVRHAISRLVYLGFLQTLPQSGTFIADFRKNASLELLVDIISSDEEVDKSILIELMEIRRIFESYCAGRAVIKMDELIDKNLLFVGGSIGTVHLCVKNILATRCGVLHGCLFERHIPTPVF